MADSFQSVMKTANKIETLLLPRVQYPSSAFLCPLFTIFLPRISLVDMDPSVQVADQKFNGGIIVVSYIISAIGAMTALELLTRRTHIKGLYNWSVNNICNDICFIHKYSQQNVDDG